MKAFHGWLTEEFLAQFTGRVDNAEILGIRVCLSPWMQAGRAVTFVFEPHDFDVFQAIRHGQFRLRPIVWIVPGHLEGIGDIQWSAEEAADCICREYSGCDQARRIIEGLGTSPKPVEPDPEFVEEVVRRVLAEMH